MQYVQRYRAALPALPEPTRPCGCARPRTPSRSHARIYAGATRVHVYDARKRAREGRFRAAAWPASREPALSKFLSTMPLFKFLKYD